MRKILVVALREYLAAVKTKSFVIGIVLLPVLMSGGFIAQKLLKNQVDVRPKHFAVVDRTPDQKFYTILEEAAEQRNQQLAEPGKTPKPPFILEKVPLAADAGLEQTRLSLSERVRTGDLNGFLEIGSEILKPPPPSATPKFDPESDERAQREPQFESSPELEPHALRYQTNRPSNQDFPRWASTVLTSKVLAIRAATKNIGPQDVAQIVQPVPLFTKGLTTRDARTGEIKEAGDQSPIVAFLLPGGLIVLMFMVVLIGAAPLMQGVIEEKMQRIAEVLLGSIRPFQLMLGKLIGMAGMSLTMAGVYLAGAYVAVRHYGYAEYLTPEIIAWFLVYQVLAVLMYGSLYGAVGAACNDMKEAQAMLTPLTLITMIPLFIWVNVVKEPTSGFATAVSLFPPATPMLMLARQAIPPGIPLWQPILGIALVIATTLLCVYAAGRIFRVGLLMQGNPPRLRDLLRWVVQG